MGTLRDYGIKEREWEKFTALDSRRADGFQCTNSWEGHHSSICFDRDKTALQHFPSLNVFSCDCIYIMASYQQNSTLSSIKLFHWVWSTTALARLHPQSPSLSQCRSFSLSLSPLYFLWCIDLKKILFYCAVLTVCSQHHDSLMLDIVKDMSGISYAIKSLCQQWTEGMLCWVCAIHWLNIFWLQHKMNETIS